MTTKQLLYVSSNVDTLQEIRKFSNQVPNCYEIDWCSNIIKALQKLVCRDFDLIIVQVNEHNTSGVCDLSAIRDIDPSIPIVALVDHFDEMECLELFENGADEIVEKEKVCTPALSRVLFTAINRKQCRLTLKSIQNIQVEDDSQWKFLFHNLLRDLRHQASPLSHKMSHSDCDNLSAMLPDAIKAVCENYESYSKLKQYNPNFELTVVNSFHFLSQFYKGVVLELKQRGTNVRISLDKAYPRQLLTDPGRLQQVLNQLVADYCKQHENILDLEIEIKYHNDHLSFFLKSQNEPGKSYNKRRQIYPPFKDNEIAITLIQQLLGEAEFFYDSRGNLVYALTIKVPKLEAGTNKESTDAATDFGISSSCLLNHGRVLLLESQDYNYSLISNILKRTGLQVLRADNEHSFLHQLSTNNFNLLIADTDYFDSSFVFLNAKKLSTSPIVFVTSDHLQNHTVFSPDFALAKPLQEYEVLRLVYEIFQSETVTTNTSPYS